MTPGMFHAIGISPALKLLPPDMDSPAARAMVLAICLQESGLRARQQRNGPARGYAQFEIAGCAGVLSHKATKDHATRICALLDVQPAATAVHRAIEYHDVLAAAFARLLLWTLPQLLPRTSGDSATGYALYLEAWRPGKPRPDEWPANYRAAWELIDRIGNPQKS